MTMRPGSFAWLLRHDLRLNWRRFADMLGNASTTRTVAILLGGAAVLHALAWPLVPLITPHLSDTGEAGSVILAFIVCTFSWMTAQSLFTTTRTLYDRGDLDLLLGSPLSEIRILAAKATAIAIGTMGSVALLVLPIANVGALVAGPAWLSIYPILASLAAIATAIGISLSLGLVRLVGPRRARLVTQLTGAAIGGGFVLGAQVLAVIPTPQRMAFMDWTIGRDAATSQHAWAWLPVDALRGDAMSLSVLVTAGLVSFAAVIALLGKHFAATMLAVAGAPAAEQRRAGRAENYAFRAGLGRALRRKEWRLLARDPSLFSQLALQIIYTIPVAVVLLRSETLPTVIALAPTIVVIAAQVAASISWITVSGEDAPELIASAPITPRSVDFAKLTAVAWPVAMILALPFLGLALISVPAALIALVFSACAATSTALLNFWHPMPGNRRGMLRRHSQSKLIALVEHGLAILWALAVVFAMVESLLAAVPILISVAVLAVARRGGSARRGSRSKEPAPPVLVAPVGSQS